MPLRISRQELIEKLKNLAESEPPTDLSSGACCYAIMPYSLPCPTCGCDDVGSEHIDAYHESLSLLGIEADLKINFCPECKQVLTPAQLRNFERLNAEKPNIPLSKLDFIRPKLHIPLKETGEIITIPLRNSVDLKILIAFLHGENKCGDAYDCEFALKNCLSKLCTMLGISPEEIGWNTPLKKRKPRKIRPKERNDD